MRNWLLATAVLLVAGQASAETVTPVKLLARHDYAFVPWSDTGDAHMWLTDPGGRVVVDLTGSTGALFPTGIEFRAQFSAVYMIHASSSDGKADALIYPDCRGGLANNCHLAPNHTQQSTFAWGFDSDWRQVKLLAGHRYVFTCIASDVAPLLRLRDAGGHVLAQADSGGTTGVALAFAARRSATYYVEAQNTDGDGGYNYAIGLK